MENLHRVAGIVRLPGLADGDEGFQQFGDVVSLGKTERGGEIGKLFFRCF